MTRRTLTPSDRAPFPNETRLRGRIERLRRVQPLLKQKIVQLLRHDGFLTPEAAEEAAFHLTDWVVELEDLVALFHKSRWDQSLAKGVLMDFVTHAPQHLVAAHRILMGGPVTDVFELGAVKGSGRAKRIPGVPYRSNRHEPHSPKRYRK